jgi:hypothetical protein
MPESDWSLKGYNERQITYGKWRVGQNAEADRVGRYLNENWHNPNIGGYFDTTYDRAIQAMKMRKQRDDNQ